MRTVITMNNLILLDISLLLLCTSIGITIGYIKYKSNS